MKSQFDEFMMIQKAIEYVIEKEKVVVAEMMDARELYVQALAHKTLIDAHHLKRMLG